MRYLDRGMYNGAKCSYLLALNSIAFNSTHVCVYFHKCWSSRQIVVVSQMYVYCVYAIMAIIFVIMSLALMLRLLWPLA